MASSDSLKRARKLGDDKDLISALPTDVIHQILEKMPLLTAIRTSVLSKSWKDNWSSLRNLVFDANFWQGQKRNEILYGEKYCNIVTNILFSHNGPVHKFLLYIPKDLTFIIECLNLSPWISFLSKNGVENIEISNRFSHSPVSISSNIFWCTHLVKLRLEFVTLSPPPTDFAGFANLQSLFLVKILSKHNSCQSLISKCPRLRTLIIDSCDGVNHIVLDAPFLKILVIRGAFESLNFKNIKNIFGVGLCLKEPEVDSMKAKLVHPLVTLATSRKLLYLRLGGDLLKFLNAGGIRSHPLTFHRLSRLSLVDLDLGDFDVFCSTCFMICRCPNINILEISVTSRNNAVQPIYDYDDDKKTLSHLRTVTIEGISGTIVELKLIEHLLAISTSLKNFFYKCDMDTQVVMSRELVKFPRASPGAQLVYLEA